MNTLDSYFDRFDGSCLEFTEALRLVKNTIYKQRYRYHYRKEDSQIFRYDNAPHHPHLETFPHHKHDASDEPMEATEVSLKEVLDEIAALLLS